MKNTEEMIEKAISDYTSKYAHKHNISEEDAKQHIMVKITEEYFRGKVNDYQK